MEHENVSLVFSGIKGLNRVKAKRHEQCHQGVDWGGAGTLWKKGRTLVSFRGNFNSIIVHILIYATSKNSY